MPSVALVAVLALASVRLRVAVTKVKSHVLAATTRLVSKAVKCPLQRRLPKRGFKSTTLKYNDEVTLADLQQLGAAEVDMLTLKAAGLVASIARVVKVVKTGELTKAVKLNGIGATAGAKAAIEAAGGSVA